MALVTLLKRGAASLHVQDYTTAQADSEQVLAFHPDPYTTYKAYELRATLFTALGKEFDALEAWTQAITRCQTLPKNTVSAEEQAQLVLERGKCYARLKRYQEAISDFSLAILIDATCAEAHCWQGLTCAYLGNEAQAISSCNHAVELQPEQAVFWHIRGVALRILNQFEEALADLDQAIMLDPENAAIQQDRRHTLLKACLMLDHPSAAAVFAKRPVPSAQPHPATQPQQQTGKKRRKGQPKRKQTALHDQQGYTLF